MEEQRPTSSPYYMEEAFRGWVIVMTIVVTAVYAATLLFVPGYIAAMGLFMLPILFVAELTFLFVDGGQSLRDKHDEAYGEIE